MIIGNSPPRVFSARPADYRNVSPDWPVRDIWALLFDLFKAVGPHFACHAYEM